MLDTQLPERRIPAVLREAREPRACPESASTASAAGCHAVPAAPASRCPRLRHQSRPWYYSVSNWYRGDPQSQKQQPNPLTECSRASQSGTGGSHSRDALPAGAGTQAEHARERRGVSQPATPKRGEIIPPINVLTKCDLNSNHQHKGGRKAAPYRQAVAERQVLDSYNNKTYSNGQAGSIYKQFIPLANAMRKPGEWQAYADILHGPRRRSTRTGR